jgi:DNA primase
MRLVRPAPAMDFKDRVKDAADIGQVIGEVVRLKRLGPNRMIGLCPFHQEKTPSFNVHLDKQFFYCFGCQKGGDVFRFVMEMEAVGFFDALKSLAERYGIPLPQRTDLSDAASRERDALLTIQRIAYEHFRRSLNAEARRYLESRHVQGETIEEFGLGYAPPGATLARILSQEGFSREEQLASGLIAARDDGSLYDRFRHRLMFPIHNESGKTIAFGGRALGDDEPKYLNSSDSKLYTKKRVLYNLNRAKEAIRRDDFSILVEGYMDVIGLVQAGMRNVVASCGTALSEDHVRAIKRHSDRVVVNFDPDRAGANAAERSIQMLLEESMKIRVLALEDGLDPDEFVAKYGADGYKSRLMSAEHYFQWLAGRARGRFDMSTAEGRMEGFRALLKPALDRVPDNLERLAVVNDLSIYLKVDARAILDQLKRGAAQPAGASRAAPALPAEEALLVRSLIEHAEEAAPYLDQLMAMTSWREFRSAPILEAMAKQSASGPVEYDELAARLEPANQSLLAAAVFADKGEERTTIEQLAACIVAIGQRDRDGELAATRERIRDLERAGKLAEAMELSRQLPREGGTRRRGQSSRG